MTELKASLVNISRPAPLKFLLYLKEEITNERYNGESICSGGYLYDMYKTWCSNNNENCVNNTKFRLSIGDNITIE